MIALTIQTGRYRGPISRGPGWQRIADVALPVMQEIIRNHYPEGGEIMRAVAAGCYGWRKYQGTQRRSPVISLRTPHPCANTTNPKVWFTINGRPYQFQFGQAYEINNQKQHSVVNRGAEDRITFIFDYIPPGSPLAYDSEKGTTRH